MEAWYGLQNVENKIQVLVWQPSQWSSAMWAWRGFYMLEIEQESQF